MESRYRITCADVVLCNASRPNTHATRAQSRDLEVDDALTKAQEEVRNKIRILLLGAGECGKSTVLKQVRR